MGKCRRVVFDDDDDDVCDEEGKASIFVLWIFDASVVMLFTVSSSSCEINFFGCFCVTSFCGWFDEDDEDEPDGEISVFGDDEEEDDVERSKTTRDIDAAMRMSSAAFFEII